MYQREGETGLYHATRNGEGGHVKCHYGEENPCIARDGDGNWKGLYGGNYSPVTSADGEKLYHVREE